MWAVKTLAIGGTVLWLLYAAFVVIWYPGIPAAIFHFIGGVL